MSAVKYTDAEIAALVSERKVLPRTWERRLFNLRIKASLSQTQVSRCGNNSRRRVPNRRETVHPQLLGFFGGSRLSKEERKRGLHHQAI